MTKELAERIKTLEQEVTKWKFKYNSKNADYVLLHQEFAEYKKKPMNQGIIIGGIALVAILVYYYSKDAQEEL